MLWSVHSLRTYIAPGLDLDLLCIYMENSPTVVRQFLMNMKKIYANDTELHPCGHDLLSVQHGF